MSQPRHFPGRSGSRQQGSVLIISLVILLVLTLLGVAAMNSTTLQERMAGNSQQVNTAFQAAEAGLRDGEEYAASTNINELTVFSTDCDNGLCEPAPASVGVDVWDDTSKVNWSTGYHTILYGAKTGKPAIPGLAKQPRYIIEKLHTVDRSDSLRLSTGGYPVSDWYRVTAVGYGRHDHAEAMVQSVIRK